MPQTFTGLGVKKALCSERCAHGGGFHLGRSAAFPTIEPAAAIPRISNRCQMISAIPRQGAASPHFRLMCAILAILLQFSGASAVAEAEDKQFKVSARKAVDVEQDCKLQSGELARRFVRKGRGHSAEVGIRVADPGPPPSYELLFVNGEYDFIRNVTIVSPCHTYIELSKPGEKPVVYAVGSATLSRPILVKAINPLIDRTSVSQRLEIVSLFVQMSRYDDAREELKAIAADFPDHNLDTQFAQLERLQRKPK